MTLSPVYCFIKRAPVKPAAILQHTAHRPWDIPAGRWAYYQEWNDALFLHWKVDGDELAKLVPAGLSPDCFDGAAWISVVAFTMERIRPWLLPSFPPVSDFHEINVRTYLTGEDKPGVFFLSIEAQKRFSARVARLLSGLPYEHARMSRGMSGDRAWYSSGNRRSGSRLEARYTVGREITDKSALDLWLTERYCLYMQEAGKVHRYEIHHRPWRLYEVDIHELVTVYSFGGLLLDRRPDLAHYSDGVQVLAWEKEAL